MDVRLERMNPFIKEAHGTMLTTEELLAKASQPAKDAMLLHPFYRGKIQTALKCPVRGHEDFGIWYTPGVAAPCLAIQEDEELAYEHRG
jgi:malate dehydrogenase (oxaloacetate-decarboxylating)